MTKARVPCAFAQCVSPKRTGDGLCSLHHRQRIAGKPLTPSKDGPIEVRFWWFVDKHGPTTPHMDSPCWVWKGSFNAHGYGRVTVTGDTGNTVKWLAHRLSYRLAVVDPGDSLVRHACDNKACVRPDHLSLGTPADNARDAVERDRLATGDDHWIRGSDAAVRRNGRVVRVKLTDEQVAEMRELRSAGWTNHALAERFGIKPNTVSAIATGRKRRIEG